MLASIAIEIISVINSPKSNGMIYFFLGVFINIPGRGNVLSRCLVR
jgi:hypothetical protein